MVIRHDLGRMPWEFRHGDRQSLRPSLVLAPLFVEDAPNGGDQLVGGEGLDKVFVGTEFETGHAVAEPHLAGEYYDGNVAHLAHTTKDLKAVHVRQQQVQQNEIGLLTMELSQALLGRISHGGKGITPAPQEAWPGKPQCPKVKEGLSLVATELGRRLP